jgi:anti-anti-sigma regulatory factor
LTLSDSEVRALVVNVAALRTSDVGTVDALARLALCAGRDGCDLVVVGASPELRELLALAGLTRVVRCEPPALSPRAAAARRAGRTAPCRGRT